MMKKNKNSFMLIHKIISMEFLMDMGIVHYQLILLAKRFFLLYRGKDGFSLYPRITK